MDGYGACFAPDSYALWREAIDWPRVRLPATEEFVRFYEALNEVYRSTFGRAAREAPDATDVRVEGLVGYLSYRMEGCDHREAEVKTLQRMTGVPERSLCATVSLTQEMPPADQTYAFNTRLDQRLRENRGGAAASTTHVDLEGEAVWLQAYAAQRARGVGEQAARAAVLAAVRAAAR